MKKVTLKEEPERSMNILYLDYVIPNKGVNLYLKKLNDNVTEFSNTDHLIKL